MTTAADLITGAFNKVGVYSPTAAQTAAALISLNNLVSFLGAEGLQNAVVSESFALTIGTASYTIGSAGAFNTVRPMKVVNCYLRDSSGYDYPIDEILAAKDYNDITIKTYEQRPTKLYFIPEYPLAKIIFNSEPEAAYTAYFEFLKTITEFAATTTALSLPPEYQEFFVYNLAISLAEDWDRKIPDSVRVRAAQTKEVIIALIASNMKPPEVKFDFNRRRPSNILSGE
ncbi:MAG: hypothetical protein WC476_12700 [Phycisphaerae bacterium]|jgi:hypothetical protein